MDEAKKAELTEKAKKIALICAEDLVKEVVIPLVKEKVKESEATWDDAIYAMFEDAMKEMADKIDGEVG